MNLEFLAVSEGEPGSDWQELFAAYWPKYRSWYLSEGIETRPSLAECTAALEYHMPELVPVWGKLCELAGGDETASRFLTLYRPPAFFCACSQAVWNQTQTMLVRNYDYSETAFDALALRTRWRNRAVVGMSDCLVGLLDGMNSDGLAVSLTWGGSFDTGDGFGIPIILRYVLETCSTAREATQTLARLPSHMAYNVTVVDASGETATVSVSPHHAAVTNDVGYATNHQDAFPGTIMPDSVLRQLAILDELEGRAASVDELIAAFLKPPLYSAAFSEGRGTLYTAAYHVDHRVLELVWPGRNWHLPLNGFEHQRLEVGYGAAADQIENIYVPAGIRAVSSRN